MDISPRLRLGTGLLAPLTLIVLNRLTPWPYFGDITHGPGKRGRGTDQDPVVVGARPVLTRGTLDEVHGHPAKSEIWHGSPQNVNAAAVHPINATHRPCYSAT